MKTINNLKKYSFYALMATGLFFASCSDDDEAPEAENEEEVITDVQLIFTNNADDKDVVKAMAQDPDGEGIEELEVKGPINLKAETTYTLTMKIENKLDPNDPEDITEEIEGEDDEHQFFFSFSSDAFSNPEGNGNIDKASDPLIYNDQDENGNKVGLSTSWTTSASALADGTFTVRLQHQPDGLKTATSGVEAGDADFILPFVLNIQAQ